MKTGKTQWDRLLLDARAMTLVGDRGYGLIEDAAIGIAGHQIVFAGRRADLPFAPDVMAERVELMGGALVTPGLIDAHTHLVFAGHRANEFEMRLNGASYAEIAQAGGGILSTVNATRSASEDELLATSLPRARALLRDGVTTLEIKSGYGLDLDSERRQLRVAQRIARTLGIEVKLTYLALHALPPEFAGRRGDFIDAVCSDWLPTLHAEGLVDAVDGFCEGIAFSPAETRRLFDAARALNLPVKLHADQLSDLDGAAIAAEYAGLSADHLEYTNEAAVARMATAGTVAMLLPAAFYCLRETRLPPIEAFRRHGVAMAVASDLNPGTSPMLSLRLAMNQACTLFRLTPEEAIRGATVHAATALGLSGRKGRLMAGHDADLAVWDTDSPAELCYWMGGPGPIALFAGGERLY
ncbi:MAG TPA: imidazolonepropionase [Patescibacteria group bacterium]|nr:imidazolonepropionase [Patescibacteria group bacterium]